METVYMAIPQVPMQEWTQVYDLPTALAEGTIFPELNKPFYVAPENSNTTLPRTDDAHVLFAQVCFALDDALLYLDTHPEDVQAKKFYQTYLEKKKELLAECTCGCDCFSHYQWDKKPLVGEGGHC